MEVDESSSFESCNRGLLKPISGILSTDEVMNYQGQALVTESLPNRVADKTTLPIGVWDLGFGVWSSGLGFWALELGLWALDFGVLECGV
jgi:hypothetical protein